MATIKTLLQNVANSIGVAPPSAFVGSSDQTAARLLRAANRAGNYLRSAHNWRALTFEHTITTASGTTSYALPTAPRFHHFLPGTGFNRDLSRGLGGPLRRRRPQASPLAPARRHADGHAAV